MRIVSISSIQLHCIPNKTHKHLVLTINNVQCSEGNCEKSDRYCITVCGLFLASFVGERFLAFEDSRMLSAPQATHGEPRILTKISLYYCDSPWVTLSFKFSTKKGKTRLCSHHTPRWAGKKQQHAQKM